MTDTLEDSIEPLMNEALVPFSNALGAVTIEGKTTSLCASKWPLRRPLPAIERDAEAFLHLFSMRFVIRGVSKRAVSSTNTAT
jgi:hypothetical protein